MVVRQVVALVVVGHWYDCQNIAIFAEYLSYSVISYSVSQPHEVIPNSKNLVTVKFGSSMESEYLHLFY